MSALLDVAGGVALVAGLAIVTIGVVALFRMRGTLAQVQGAAVAPIGAILLAVAAPLIAHDLETAGRAALVVVFVLLTAPVSAHLTAHAADHGRSPDEPRPDR